MDTATTHPATRDGAIVARVVAANVAARAYRSIIEQTFDDPEMRNLMLDGLAFDCAKDEARAQDARLVGRFWNGTKACVSLAVGDRRVEVVVNVVTCTGRVMSDERTVAA